MARVLSPYAVTSPAIKNQRAFTKDDFIKTKFIFRLLFLIAFMAILSLFYIWSRVQIVQVGYEINNLQHQQAKLVEHNKKLSVEVATLKSHKRVERIAKTKLLMTPPQAHQIRSIQSNVK